MISKKQITKWNEEFKGLSKAEQRVLIAKDVIKQLKAYKYLANTGNYVETLYDLSEEGQVQEQFDKIYGCNVCALGACLLSTIKYSNKITAIEVNENMDDIWVHLSKYFPLKQIAMIEHAFELWNQNDNGIAYNNFDVTLTDSQVDKCYAFGRKYKEDEEARLKAIMLNIIENKGTFRP